VLTIHSTIIDTNNNPSKYLPLPYHGLSQDKKTSMSGRDRDMKESEEYEEINMFHTNKNIVKGHFNLNFKMNDGEGIVPRPML
jgi:hypothetical protein